MDRHTFALDLASAEFVLSCLPPSDGFTRELQAWVDEERQMQAIREQLAEERAERYAPIFNGFLWRVVGRTDA